ncbi:LCM-domain-containing protein [Eremomyces bilateralis CBS 781.70]|uniref:tRNA wybutosine-synthesizing protein 4 n=1 Tax=Eremomyces bilateralis CBS 781.70 TaxID=1392243 RepID=A0A6G1G839_9PEZI|nr:LCM-domain-containing protein [Eremomyces bilateralis CBS 781.70]KAF1814228.1 LCM-domain-containing protein [Eremomyces bilateralis CBS 781.70]
MKRPMETSSTIKASSRDEAIIGTNDYSIVSKRSVERLYNADESEFLHHFVPKFKRRAPAINRGYWLRVHAIEFVVLRFLEECRQAGKQVAVVNLGCGYDTLPFRTRWKAPQLCGDCVFVDVDYPSLIQRKAEKIRRENLFGLTPTTGTASEAVSLETEEGYYAVGCDLRHPERLQQILTDELGLHGRHFIFLAEVSLAYVDYNYANTLIDKLSSISNSRFCILEQYLPDGEGHPFAQAMLNHFEKTAPLKQIRKCPSLAAQAARFRQNGWTSVQVENLWNLWQNDEFLSGEQRTALDKVEQFDEWEEFALFGAHYFVLVAGNYDLGPLLPILPQHNDHLGAEAPPVQSALAWQHFQAPKGAGLRRYGAVIPHSAQLVSFHGGQTSSAKQGNYDTYSCSSPAPDLPGPPECLSSHTITECGPDTYLCVGGRTTPSKARSACWLGVSDQWTPVEHLTPGRYRHCAVPVHLPTEQGVLVFGGRTGDGIVLGEWALWTGSSGWRRLTCPMDEPQPRFSATMACSGLTDGLLMGGLSASGTVFHDCWRWTLDGLQVLAERVSESVLPKQIEWTRFGASLVASDKGFVLIGGVGANGIIPEMDDVVCISKALHFTRLPLVSGPTQRPLLVGHGAALVKDGSLLIVGGGAICYSFGAFWNPGIYMLSTSRGVQEWFLDATPATTEVQA